MPYNSPAPWRNPRVISTLALVFLAGVSAGAFAMRFGLHDKLHRNTVAAAAREPSRDAVLQNFKTKLDLSTEQTEQIAMVLEDYRQYYESLQEQLDDLRATGRNRILQVLAPEQRDKFEKMMGDLAPQLDSTGK